MFLFRLIDTLKNKFFELGRKLYRQAFSKYERLVIYYIY